MEARGGARFWGREIGRLVIMSFRFRELLIRQRRQIINALRGHLAEFGQSYRKVQPT